MTLRNIMIGTIQVLKIVSILCWFFLLFLMAINFQNEIDELFKLFFYYSLALGILFRHRFSLNLELVLLVLFANVYYFIFIDYNGFNPWSYIRLWFGATMMYIAGKTFITRFTSKFYEAILLTFAVGLLTYGSLNMYLYISSGTLPGTRVAYDFWANFPIGSTLMASYYIASGSLLFYALFHVKLKYFYVKIILFASIILGIYHNILLANRTYFVIMFVTFIAMFPLHIALKKRRAVIDFIIVAILVVSIYQIYRTDALGIRTAIEATRWYGRMSFLLENGITNDPRFAVYRLVWPQIMTYLLGGYQMDLGGLSHAHNLWMDVLHTAGPYPFFLLIGYSVLTFTTLIRLLVHKRVSPEIKMILFSIFLGMNLYFMVEPILDGVPYVFSMFCIINGSTYSYLKTLN